MEFDWLHTTVDFNGFSPKDVEEIFEDPFSLKLLPESLPEGTAARYFILGVSLSYKFLFALFWTDGKNFRVISARPMTEEELQFYKRCSLEE
jgi:uncharacterized DUF497 family protein